MLYAILGGIFGPFWGLFEIIFGSFWGVFMVRLRFFLVMFWKVECTIEKNDAGEGKRMRISVRIQQNHAKLNKTCRFFVYKTLVLPVEINVSVGAPGSILNRFECFMHFYVGLDGVWVVFLFIFAGVE